MTSSPWSSTSGGPLHVPAFEASARSDDLLVDQLSREVRCILTLGSALLGYGLPASRVGEAVKRLSSAFGRRSFVFTLPTFLSVTLLHPHGHETYQTHAEAAAVDLGRLDALHSIVGCVERGELTAERAERRILQLLQAPPLHARALEVFALVLVGVGGTLALTASPGDAAMAAVLGACVGVLRWITSEHRAASRVTPVLAAAAATLLSTELARSGLLAYPLIATFASLFVFVPGLSMTLSMTELATGHLVSGTARMVGAATVFLQLGLGILLGARLSGLSTVDSARVGEISFTASVLGAAILALGFAILFGVQRKDGWATAIVSALAFLICQSVGAWLGPQLGALLAAASVGLFANAFARRFDRPSSVLSLPGMAMLVPGGLGLLSVSAAALQEPGRALSVAVQMLLLVVSLSTGVLLAAAALPPSRDL